MSDNFKCYPRRSLIEYGKHVKILGEGSYGEVTLLDGGRYGKPVAVKKSPRINEDSADVNSPTLIEIALLSRLDHPFIPKIIDVHQDKNFYYIIQESPGESIKGDEKFSNEEIIDLIYCLAEVYAYLKNEGILHLDLKPDNVLISRDEESLTAYLIDFGISRLFGPADLVVDETYTCYTQLYRPPELWMNVRNFDFKAEMWALGVLWLKLYFKTIPIEIEKVIPVNLASKFGTNEKGHIDISKFIYVKISSFENDDLAVASIVAWDMIAGPILKKWPGIKYLPLGSRLILAPNLNTTETGSIEKLTKDLRKGDRDLLFGLLTPNPVKRFGTEDVLLRIEGDHLKIPSSLECLKRRTRLIKRPVTKYITPGARAVLLDWLLEVKDLFHLPDRAYFLGIQLFDLFVGEKSIETQNVQGYGCVALKLGALMLSMTIPMPEFSRLSADAYSVEKLKGFQDEMIKVLCFDLYQGTIFDFLALYLPDREFLALVKTLRALIRTDLIYSHSPEKLAHMVKTDEKSLQSILSKTWLKNDSVDVILSKEAFWVKERELIEKYAPGNQGSP